MGFLPNERFISFLQSQEECELKVIEQEKEVTVLPPKDACKCHKEDLAKALNVSVLAVLVKIASQAAHLLTQIILSTLGNVVQMHAALFLCFLWQVSFQRQNFSCGLSILGDFSLAASQPGPMSCPAQPPSPAWSKPRTLLLQCGFPICHPLYNFSPVEIFFFN